MQTVRFFPFPIIFITIAKSNDRQRTHSLLGIVKSEKKDCSPVSCKFFEMQKSNNSLWWTKISLISPSNKLLFLVSKEMLLRCLERCTNPLNPVPTGIIPPRTTFSFRPFNQSIRPRRAAFAKTRAVS